MKFSARQRLISRLGAHRYKTVCLFNCSYPFSIQRYARKSIEWAGSGSYPEFWKTQAPSQRLWCYICSHFYSNIKATIKSSNYVLLQKWMSIHQPLNTHMMFMVTYYRHRWKKSAVLIPGFDWNILTLDMHRFQRKNYFIFAA